MGAGRDDIAYCDASVGRYRTRGGRERHTYGKVRRWPVRSMFRVWEAVSKCQYDVLIFGTCRMTIPLHPLSPLNAVWHFSPHSHQISQLLALASWRSASD